MNINRIGINRIVQDDGAQWSTFYDREINPDQHFLIVTSHGNEQFLHPEGGYKQLKSLLMSYRDAEQAKPDSDTREFLGSGQQAQVYGLTDKFAVREVVGNIPYYQALSDLTRLDRLAGIVEGGIPRWINVPSVYALYSDSDRQKQYTLMQRIDTGLTVEDIVDFDKTSEIGKSRAIKELGAAPTEEQKIETEALFEKARFILDRVIISKGLNPEELLSDWAMRNVLVDVVKTPVAGQRMVLNIIDQN